jgi:hypothetical protein
VENGPLWHRPLKHKLKANGLRRKLGFVGGVFVGVALQTSVFILNWERRAIRSQLNGVGNAN